MNMKSFLVTVLAVLTAATLVGMAKKGKLGQGVKDTADFIDL